MIVDTSWRFGHLWHFFETSWRLFEAKLTHNGGNVDAILRREWHSQSHIESFCPFVVWDFYLGLGRHNHSFRGQHMCRCILHRDTWILKDNCRQAKTKHIESECQSSGRTQIGWVTWPPFQFLGFVRFSQRAQRSPQTLCRVSGKRKNQKFSLATWKRLRGNGKSSVLWPIPKRPGHTKNTMEQSQ